MSHLIHLTIAGLLAGRVLVAPLPDARHSGGDPLADVKRAQSAFTAAMRANDAAQVESLLPADFAITHADGVVEDKTRFLASIRSGQLHTVTLREDSASYQLLGPTTALVRTRYAARFHTPDGDVDATMRVLMVWARRTTRWRLVAVHATPIVPPAPPSRP
jgi:ketosteroid isomerase-like protein